MKLITKEILDTFKKTGSQQDEKDPKIIVKYFTPWSNWTWFATEYDPETEVFFGLVDGIYREWGSFSLSELQELTGFGGLTVERDLFTKPDRISNIDINMSTIQ